MNPTTTAQPARPQPLMDVSRPPQAQAAVQPAQPAPSTTMTTSIVNNIPMHAPAQPAHPALSEDEDLDKIMQAVGHELKQADRKTTKKHFSLFGHKHHAPAPNSMPKPPVAAAASTPAPQPPAPIAQAIPAPVTPKATAKPPKTSSAPVGIIFVTLLVTGALIATAIYSYK